MVVRKLKRGVMELKEAISTIKEELDEHLDSINANTNEVQTNYEFLCRLEAKIDKLSERLDQMQLKPREQKLAISHPLTKHEKDVFMALYKGSENFITYLEIGRHLGLPEELVREYVMNLIAKGIPIVKRYVNNKAYVKIETDFRNKQTREDVVGIQSICK